MHEGHRLMAVHIPSSSMYCKYYFTIHGCYATITELGLSLLVTRYACYVLPLCPYLRP